MLVEIRQAFDFGDVPVVHPIPMFHHHPIAFPRLRVCQCIFNFESLPLVDHANSRNRQKRGGDIERVPLDESVVIGSEAPDIIVNLDDALQRLAAVDPRKSDIVQFLYFGGMTYEETAAALNISPATVDRELRMAKAWLYRELAQNPAEDTLS